MTHSFADLIGLKMSEPEANTWSQEFTRLQDLLKRNQYRIGKIQSDVQLFELNRVKSGLSSIQQALIKLINKSMRDDIGSPPFTTEEIQNKFVEISDKIDESNVYEAELICKNVADIIREGMETADENRRDIETLSSEMALLVSDNPVENIKEIQDICLRIDRLKEEEKLFIERYSNNLHTAILHLMEFDPVPECEKFDTSDDEEPLVENLELEDTITDENVKPESICLNEHHEKVTNLESKISQMELMRSAQWDEIQQARQQLMEEGVRTDIRETLQRIFKDVNECSIEDLLIALHATYPERVVILPSALKSARDSEFNNKEALWKQMKTLIIEYLDQINNGIADTNARKCFPVKMFAANESETTSKNSVGRNQRSEYYNGKKVFFEKHLRFGVAHNARESLRLHFEVIDGKIIIAHCGAHKKLIK